MKRTTHFSVAVILFASAAYAEIQSPGPVSQWAADQAITLLEVKLDGLRVLVESNDRRYTERFASQKEAIEVAISGAERALLKAEAALEKRLENTNEWRQTVSDQDKLRMSRTEAMGIFDTHARQIEKLSSRIEAIDGNSAGKAAFWGYIVGGVGVVSTLFMIFQRSKK